MLGAKDLYERVRRAQEMLGTGETEEAVAAVRPLREQAVELLRKSPMLTSFDRNFVYQAYAYATITMVLGLAESRLPAEFVPKIRELAVETAKRNRPGTDIWKAVAAAAEVLARAGDAEGACWAIKKAKQLNPNDDQLIKVAGGISSMYPSKFAETPDDAPDAPPDLPA